MFSISGKVNKDLEKEKIKISNSKKETKFAPTPEEDFAAIHIKSKAHWVQEIDMCG